MTNQTLTLYTDGTGVELFSEDKKFYAESCILDSVNTDVHEIQVEEAVALEIQCEVDGTKIYRVKPEQVLSIEKISSKVEGL